MPSPSRNAKLRVRITVLTVLLLQLGAALSASAVELTPLKVKADPGINEFSPAAGGDYLAWVQNSVGQPTHYDVFIQRPGHPRTKVNRAGTYGGGGGFSGKYYVYSEWKPESRGEEILRYDTATGTRQLYGSAVNTRYNEFHPTLSGEWLLFTRQNWDQDTYRVLLFNARTHTTRTLASGTGNNWVYSGQVNGDYVTWGRVRSSGQDVYRYRISTRETTRIPRVWFAQYNPSVAADGTVYYTRGTEACGRGVELVRQPLAGPPEVIRTFSYYYESGYSYVDDRVDGSRNVYYGTLDCRLAHRRAWDSYELVDAYTLTAAVAGTGTGTVTSSPAGVDCGADCSEVLPRGTSVTLTAAPDAGSQVSAWNAPECPTAAPTCTIEITSNRTVTVTFEPTAPSPRPSRGIGNPPK